MHIELSIDRQNDCRKTLHSLRAKLMLGAMPMASRCHHVACTEATDTDL